MTRKVALAVAMSAGLGLTGVGHATVGGPTTIDVLGWSATEQKVYVHEVTRDGGSHFGHVLVFALDAPPDAPPVEVEWTRGLVREGSNEDAEAIRRLAALRDKLEPLPPMAGTALPGIQTVLVRDTLGAPGTNAGETTHFRVLARFELADFEVSTFARPDVVIRDVRSIPGRSEVLVVLAFVGTPFEGGYETQRVVVVRAGDRGPYRIEWRHVE